MSRDLVAWNCSFTLHVTLCLKQVRRVCAPPQDTEVSSGSYLPRTFHAINNILKNASTSIDVIVGMSKPFHEWATWLLRRIFGPKRNEVTGEWRKLHNEELNDLYCSTNTDRVIKSRRMRWTGHVARMGMGEGCTGFWWGNLRERDHWWDPGIDERIILKRIFRKWDVGVWTGSSWLRIGTGGGLLWMW